MNVPEELKNKSALFIGAGGGYDVYAAIPLVLATKAKKSLLVSFGTKKGFTVRESTEEDVPTCNLPFKTYTLGKNGVQDVKDGIQELIDAYDVDTIFAVDGGVDSLMRGDEDGQGTVLEDFIVLSAISQIDIENKYLACVGFGAETEEGVNHYRVLENIAELTKSGDFIGSCSLTQGKEFQNYRQLCERSWETDRKSHIQSKVILATEGEFGDVVIEGMDARIEDPVTEEIFISPLMSIYWFFRLDGVVNRNIVIDNIKDSRSFTDALMLYRQSLQQHTRSRETIPL